MKKVLLTFLGFFIAVSAFSQLQVQVANGTSDVYWAQLGVINQCCQLDCQNTVVCVPPFSVVTVNMCGCAAATDLHARVTPVTDDCANICAGSMSTEVTTQGNCWPQINNGIHGCPSAPFTADFSNPSVLKIF